HKFRTMIDTPLPDQQAEASRDAQVIAEHLPEGYSAEFDGSTNAAIAAAAAIAGPSSSPSPSARPAHSINSADDDSAANSGSEGPTSSLKLQGGDMHREIFKTANRIKYHKRAATFHHPPPPHASAQGKAAAGAGAGAPYDYGLTMNDQLAPGGFRRAFLIRQRQRQRDRVWGARLPVTRNFVEFLDLYGSFAGEDLADSDEEAVQSSDEEEGRAGAGGRRGGKGRASDNARAAASRGGRDDDDDDREGGPSGEETRPLLGLRRRSTTQASRNATASTTKTFFTLLKAFIGTGIMFLPRAFRNGGILFSSMTLLTVSAVTMLAFHLLLACKARYGGGYGEIGQAIAGDRMRGLILGSITLSQLGFVCAGIVFVAENVTSFLIAVFRRGEEGAESPLSTMALVLLQVLALIPLSFVRNIAKLGPAALVADICILLGVGYIYYYDVAHLASDGMHPTVVLFNPDSYTLTVGAAIFTFEGIGLILPIESSMAKPERFEHLLGAVMLIITVLFTSVGALCYATFGEDTYIEIINNYPQTSRFVNAVQFLYSVAVLVGNPVQLFPALRIMEGKLFGAHASGKKSRRTKWVKNAFRAAVVAACGAVAVLGAGNLDRFVALIGSCACVPLVYIYPAYLHYRGVAASWPARAADLVFVALGVVCMVYTTAVTLANSFL
ncbi:hypothetical protein SLS62_003726, partial [Diatrype stigma]